MNDFVTGVDIGGTHITASIVNVADGTAVDKTRIRSSIDPSRSREYIIDVWANAIRKSNEIFGRPVNKIGIAMPGPFDYETGISWITGLHKYECLYGLNVKQLLADALQVPAAQIRLVNDATAFLTGELKSGAAISSKHVAGVTLGTGTGSAFYIRGKHEDGDLWCMPFRGSHAEEFLSSRWFITEYNKRSLIKISGVKDLAERADEDETARELFREFGYTLAEVLTQRLSEDFPGKIVIGGNIAKAWLLFYPYCLKALQQNQFNGALVPALLGEDAALVGAACLWAENREQ